MSTDTRLRFNKKALENVPLPPPGSRLTFHDSEVPGLQLRVTDRGIKSFCVFRRSKRGAPERITIGRFPTLSVERAWVKAKRYLADLGEGISVVAQQRNSGLEGRTLDDLHKEYLASRGVTLVTVQRKDGKSVEQPRLSPNAKLKASTARDYVTAMAKKFADWRNEAAPEHYPRHGRGQASSLESTFPRGGESGDALPARSLRVCLGLSG